MSTVLGIIGIVLLPVLAGLVMGIIVRRIIDKSEDDVGFMDGV